MPTTVNSIGSGSYGTADYSSGASTPVSAEQTNAFSGLMGSQGMQGMQGMQSPFGAQDEDEDEDEDE